jgi:DNA repair ATPase RecN
MVHIRLNINIPELQTDHKSTMAKIEKLLVEYHADLSKSGQAQKEIEEYEANLEKKKDYEKKQLEIQKMNEELKKKAEKLREEREIPIPFCLINTVVDNSPAYKGGKYQIFQ